MMLDGYRPILKLCGPNIPVYSRWAMQQLSPLLAAKTSPRRGSLRIIRRRWWRGISYRNLREKHLRIDITVAVGVRLKPAMGKQLMVREIFMQKKDRRLNCILPPVFGTGAKLLLKNGGCGDGFENGSTG